MQIPNPIPGSGTPGVAVETLYRALAQNSPDIIISQSNDGRITTWNHAAESAFGFSESEMLGKPASSVLVEDHPVPRGTPSPPLSVHFDETPVVGRHKDGNRSVWLFRTYALEDSAGARIGWARVSSGRKPRNTEAIRAADDLRAALDEHAIVAVTDPRGDITWVNQRFCDISKYSADELIGQNHRIINSGYHPPEFFRDLWATISSGRVWRGNVRNRAKDGSLYWVATTIVPFFDNRNRIRQYVAIRADITAQKDAESALEARTKELVRSNAALEEFAYAASHDLQEPLRGLASCVDYLAEQYQGRLDERADEFIRHAIMNAARLQELIYGLLKLSRLERPTGPPPLVDTRQVLNGVLSSLASTIEQAGAEVVVKGELPKVRVDGIRLNQLFHNLIANALKFRGTLPPRIVVSAGHNEATEASGGVCEFSVADNGIGIDPRHRETIFRVFKRLHPQDKYPGPGIGLSLCQHIVEQYGGRIWVESELGRGSVFHFTLPARPTGREISA